MPARARAVKTSPAPVGKHRDAAQKHAHQSHEQNILVANMRDLMRHHALGFLPVEQGQQAGRYANRRVLFVGARGQRVGRRIEDHVHPRHRRTRRQRHFGHDVVELAVLGSFQVQLLGAERGKNHVAAAVVRRQRRRRRYTEREKSGERQRRSSWREGIEIKVIDGRADDEEKQDEDGHQRRAPALVARLPGGEVQDLRRIQRQLPQPNE